MTPNHSVYVQAAYVQAARACIRKAYMAQRNGQRGHLYLQAARNWIECARLARESARVARP